MPGMSGARESKVIEVGPTLLHLSVAHINELDTRDWDSGEALDLLSFDVGQASQAMATGFKEIL